MDIYFPISVSYSQSWTGLIVPTYARDAFNQRWPSTLEKGWVNIDYIDILMSNNAAKNIGMTTGAFDFDI